MNIMVEKFKVVIFYAILICAVYAPTIDAAPFEVKIHDELIAPHQEYSFEAEIKLYKPPTAGAIGASVLQSRFEIAKGISTSSEVSVNLFTSAFNNQTQINGGKIAHIFIPEHDESGWFHYGIKNEINSIYGLNEAHAVFIEMTPILGFHIDSWRMTLNPSVDLYLNGDRKTIFAPAGKISRKLTGDYSLGLEYYSETGPIKHPTPFTQRPDAAYLVFDTHTTTSTYSVGIGKGIHAVGDRWVVKLIGSIPLNF